MPAGAGWGSSPRPGGLLAAGRYVMPPLFLAAVTDRVVAVARRHVPGEDERSLWLAAAPLVPYTVRLVLARPGTAGLRRWLLVKIPLPGATAPAVAPAPQRRAIGGRPGLAGPRAGSKTARLLAPAGRHGPRAGLPPGITRDGLSQRPLRARAHAAATPRAQEGTRS